MDMRASSPIQMYRSIKMHDLYICAIQHCQYVSLIYCLVIIFYLHSLSEYISSISFFFLIYMCRHYFITGLWTNNNVAKSLFIHCVEHWPQIPDCNMYYFSLAKVRSRYLAGLMYSSKKKIYAFSFSLFVFYSFCSITVHQTMNASRKYFCNIYGF